MRPPKHMWVLIDLANGDAGYGHGGHNYLFWFYARHTARKFKKEHESKPGHTDLAGPFRYNFVLKK